MGPSPCALAPSAAPALARAGLAWASTGKGCHGDSPWESRAFLRLSGAGASLEPAQREGKGGHFLRTGLGWQIKSVLAQGECRDVRSACSGWLGTAARAPLGSGRDSSCLSSFYCCHQQEGGTSSASSRPASLCQGTDMSHPLLPTQNMRRPTDWWRKQRCILELLGDREHAGLTLRSWTPQGSGQHCQCPRPQAGPCQIHSVQERVREDAVKDAGGCSKLAPVTQPPPAATLGMTSLSTPAPKGLSGLADSVNMPQQHRHMHY